MKKEYLIGGLLGVILCGIVAYAVMTLIGVQNSERAEQLVQALPPPTVLDTALPENRQPGPEQLSDKGRTRSVSPSLAAADGRKADELKADALTEVRITLKNGRSITADFCRDAKSKLLCVVNGGRMEIDRREIASMREVKVQRISSMDSEPSDAVAEDGKPADKAAAGEKGQTPADGRMVRGFTPEQVKRLDEITERKQLMQPERERLIKEREQLHEDVKNAGVIRSQEQFDGIKKRISDLEATIINFNDEIKKLNEEEKGIIDSSAAK